MMTCLNEGDEIIIPEPFYANYNGFSTQAGVTVVPVFSSIRNGFALPPHDEFEKVITPRTKAIMICNPSNPTGHLYSKEELESLRDLALKHDLYLFLQTKFTGNFVMITTAIFQLCILKG